MVVLAIRDVKADCFKAPHFSLAVGAAIREFSDAVLDSNSFISKHPEDYQLFKLAEFDEITGRIKSLEFPELLVSATEFIKRGEI